MSKTNQALANYFQPSEPKIKTIKQSKTMYECLAEIEEMAESQDLCTKIVSEKLGITVNMAQEYLTKLVKSGALVKTKEGMRILGVPYHKYELAGNVPKQVKLIDDGIVARDWLQVAFWGEKTCVTR